MTTKQTDRDEAISELRARLKPGQEILCVLRHVSRSGMQRVIDLKVIEGGEMRGLGWSAARAVGYQYDTKRDGAILNGCGMDMGFEFVYNLGRALWPDGVPCIGERCHSNDHSNGMKRPPACVACGIAQRSEQHLASCLLHEPLYAKHRDSGYALKSRWV